MGVEENKATIHRVFDEIVNQGNLELVRELYTDDMVDNDPMPGAPAGTGPDPVIWSLGELRRAFPDLKVEIIQLVGEGDYIAERAVWRGTNTGPTAVGGPPTGKYAEWQGMVFWRFENGKIAERWGVLDVAGMLQQLGVIPPMGATPKDIGKFIVSSAGRSMRRVLSRSNSG
jgi:steroid delta-isomerase-like uncharacterized protein